MNDPCRVSLDVRAHYGDLNTAEPAESFDPSFDEHISAVVPYELVNPVHELMLSLFAAEESLTLSTEEKLQLLKKAAQQVRSACNDRWRDL